MDIIQKYHEDGKTLKSKKWYIKGKTDKNSLLKQEEYYINGIIIYKMYYIEGKLHKDFDEPAFINYHKDGKISSQSWYQNGKYYRDNDKPTHIQYNNDESITYQIWYDVNEKIIKKECYKNGKIFTSNVIISYYGDEEQEYCENHDEILKLVITKFKFMFNNQDCNEFTLTEEEKKLNIHDNIYEFIYNRYSNAIQALYYEDNKWKEFNVKQHFKSIWNNNIDDNDKYFIIRTIFYTYHILKKPSHSFMMV